MVLYSLFFWYQPMLSWSMPVFSISWRVGHWIFTKLINHPQKLIFGANLLHSYNNAGHFWTEWAYEHLLNLTAVCCIAKWTKVLCCYRRTVQQLFSLIVSKIFFFSFPAIYLCLWYYSIIYTRYVCVCVRVILLKLVECIQVSKNGTSCQFIFKICINLKTKGENLWE